MQVQGIKGYRDLHMKNGPATSLEAYKNYLLKRNRQLRIAYYADMDCEIHNLATKLRRAVIMRKQGETWQTIGYAVGMSGSAIKKHIDFLPLELQP